MPAPFSTALLATSALWIAFELGLVARRRAAPATSQDAGTLRRLNLVIYGSVALGVTLARTGIGHLPLPPAARWAGLAVIALGLALRVWAILVLGRSFTVNVAIRPGQALVEQGPYRWVRHPAYTGSLLSFLGLALAEASWIAAAVILVPITLAFLQRIAVEERALQRAFPSEYPPYAARTRRLIPWLY
jgi:protein-S-isoprenylcysteine O-methyltransferase